MKKIDGIKKPGRKWMIIVMAVIITGVTAAGVLMLSGGGKNVEFKTMSEKDIPQKISSGVIPEYRELERALACSVDEKIYVIVTRGEKPASGYNVDIDRMKLESDDGKETLIVYATFTDPAKEDSVSQVLNYPVKVALTELSRLPDEIELRIQYDE